jgi:hypothetical protein
MPKSAMNTVFEEQSTPDFVRLVVSGPCDLQSALVLLIEGGLLTRVDVEQAAKQSRLAALVADAKAREGDIEEAARRG